MTATAFDGLLPERAPSKRRSATTTAPSPAEPTPTPVTAPVLPAGQVQVPTLDIKTMLVTPAQARKWLGANADDNRHQRNIKIEAYARDMQTGKWQVTADTIKLTPDGVLIDGQHRLQAVLRSGVSVYMVVAFGVPRSAMAVIDTGISRTFADTLRGAGVVNRIELGAIVRRITVWDKGNRMGKGGENPTHQELAARFDLDRAGFVAATARGIDCYRARVTSAAIGGSAYYLFHRIDVEAAHDFFDKLVSGANLAPKDAILTVRERLIRARHPAARRPGARDDRLDVAEQLALLVRGWNAFREGRTLERAPITNKGILSGRNFPTPL